MEEFKKQARNIDEQGNVLYLDEERLERKKVGFPPFQNHPNGLGIYNFIKEHIIYMRKSLWPLALKLYRFFIKYSAWMKEGGWKGNLFMGMELQKFAILVCMAHAWLLSFE